MTTGLLAWIVILGIAILGGVIQVALLRRLRSNHHEKWVQLGEPTYLSTMWMPTQMKMLDFLWGGSHRTLKDRILGRLVWAMRIMTILLLLAVVAAGNGTGDHEHAAPADPPGGSSHSTSTESDLAAEPALLALWVTLMVLTITGGVLSALIHRRLKHHHRQVWEQMGSPALFWNTSWRIQENLNRFLMKSSHSELGDPVLNRLGTLSRRLWMFTFVLFVIFFLWVALGVFFPRTAMNRPPRSGASNGLHLLVVSLALSPSSCAGQRVEEVPSPSGEPAPPLSLLLLVGLLVVLGGVLYRRLRARSWPLQDDAAFLEALRPLLGREPLLTPAAVLAARRHVAAVLGVPPERLSASQSLDALGRQIGYLAEFSVALNDLYHEAQEARLGLGLPPRSAPPETVGELVSELALDGALSPGLPSSRPSARTHAALPRR